MGEDSRQNLVGEVEGFGLGGWFGCWRRGWFRLIKSALRKEEKDHFTCFFSFFLLLPAADSLATFFLLVMVPDIEILIFVVKCRVDAD